MPNKMPNKRLENALNAGKLIKLGFKLNHGKPEKLNLLYTVSCFNNEVTYANSLNLNEDDEVNNKNKNQKNTSKQQLLKKKSTNKNEINSDSDTSSNEEDASHNSSSRKSYYDDEFEKIEILSLQFNQNLNLLATGDSNGKIKIHDIFSGLPIEQLEDEKSISSPALSKSRFNDLLTKKPIASSVVYNMPIICMKWYPYSNYSTSILYYAHVNGYIGIFDKESKRKSIIIGENDEIACIDFNKDSSLMASVGKDYTIKLYDSNLNNSSTFNTIVKTFGISNVDNYVNQSLQPSISATSFQTSLSTSSTHTNRLQSVKFSNSSNDVLFTGGWDRTVKMWDVREPNGIVNTINGPFICGSDAMDVNDNLLLTASWVKENALSLWDIRNCHKKLMQLPIVVNEIEGDEDSDARKTRNGEYLYACKFFSSSHHFNDYKHDEPYPSPTKLPKSKSKNQMESNFSTVLACGSGSQSLHLIDYEKPSSKQHLASINCKSPLYCLDAIYSCSMIACGGMKNFFTLMATSKE